MIRLLRIAGGILLLICGLLSIYLAVVDLPEAGGRFGFIPTGVLFLALAFLLLRKR